jgi:hypothetical protein
MPLRRMVACTSGRGTLFPDPQRWGLSYCIIRGTTDAGTFPQSYFRSKLSVNYSGEEENGPESFGYLA